MHLQKIETEDSGPFQINQNHTMTFETPKKNYNAASLPPRDSDDVINRKFAHAVREANTSRGVSS